MRFEVVGISEALRAVDYSLKLEIIFLVVFVSLLVKLMGMIRVLGTDNKDKDLYVFGSRVVFILLIGTVMFISSAKSEKFICNELLDRSGQIERVVSGKSYPIVYFTDGSRLELPNWREDTTSSYSSVYDTWSGRVRATTYVKEPLSQGEYEGIILDASERKVIPIKKEPER